jgi:hypothetical protein
MPELAAMTTSKTLAQVALTVWQFGRGGRGIVG